MNQKTYILIMSVVILIAGLAGFLAAAASIPQVSVAEVKTGDVSLSIGLEGSVNASGTYQVMPGIDGKVSEIFVKEGETVKAGQKLFKLDDSDLVSELKQAELELQVALENQKEAQAVTMVTSSEDQTLKDAQETATVTLNDLIQKAQTESVSYEELNSVIELALSQNNAVSVTAESTPTVKADNSKVLKAATAKVALAKEKISNIQKKIKAMTIFSTIDGKILVSSVTKGEIVTMNNNVMSIGNTDQWTVNIFAGQENYNRIEVGQTANITFNGQIYSGKVIYRSETLINNQGKQAGLVKIQPDQSFNVPVGMTLNTDIILQQTTSKMILPNECIGEDEYGKWVFCVEDGRLKRKHITTGLSDGVNTEVISGISTGTKIMFNPETDMLQNGQAVRILS